MAEVKIQTYWSDCDPAGIVYFGNFFRLFERAEEELYLQSMVARQKLLDAYGVWLPRVHVECDFFHPVTLDELLIVEAFFGKIGNSSIHLNFEVQRKENPGVIVATGKYVLVTVKKGLLAPTPVRERPRRHSKPHISRPDSEEPYVKLVLAGGREAGLRVADIVAAVTSSAGLDGEAVRDVLVLDRFSFLSVPAGEAERVIESLDGHKLAGRPLSLQRVGQ